MNKLFLFCAAAALTSAPALALVWSEPILLEELNEAATGQNARAPYLSLDGKTMSFTRSGNSQHQIVEAYRDTDTGPFTSERILTELGIRNIGSPWVSYDRLRMYHTRYDGGWAAYQLRMAYRENASDFWTPSHSAVPGTVFSEIHADYMNDGDATLTADELTIFFRSNRTEKYGLWMATRPSITDASGNFVGFSNPVEISELNDGDSLFSPCVMANGLTMYYCSIRDGYDTFDIYKATRNSLSDPFGNIEKLPFSTDAYNEQHVYVTPDELSIYFSDERGIWFSTIPEPATVGLLALGTGLIRKRKKHK